MTRLDFKIRLLSDYHVASGHGGEQADSALLRDGDGQATIRGSILAGLLRDALWRLLRHAPPGTPLAAHAGKCRASGAGPDANRYCRSDEGCPVCRIFGSPAQPKRWSVGTARPHHARTPQAPEFDPPRIGGREVRRARVSPRTRRTEPHKLFSEEQGSARWDFRFRVDCLVTDADTQAEAALIMAAARLVRGLGRSRRRGLGECRVHLENADSERELLAAFQRLYLTDNDPATSPRESNPKDGQRKLPRLNADASRSVRRRLWVRLDEPLLLALKAGGGNEYETNAEIQGTSLRGAFAAEAARRLGLRPNELPPLSFKEIFVRGRILFPTLRGVALDASGTAATPTIRAPSGLLTCSLFPAFESSDGHGTYPLGSGEAERGRCPECLSKGRKSRLTSLDVFLTVAAEPRRWRPVRRQEMHIRVDPETGRVGLRNLYGYTSLETGQFFLGDLECDAAAWEALSELCGLPEAGVPFSVSLGKATRRGHGRTAFLWESIDSDDRPPQPFRGLPLHERLAAGLNRLRMTLLTDAIIPDAWGRFYTGFEEAWVSRELDLTAGVRIIASSARPRQVDGFIGNLGLPRFRDLAICAGSDALLEVDASSAGARLEVLERIEREGIGLRRGEGFGQVVFNHPLYDPKLLGRVNMALEVPSALVAHKDGKSDLEVIEEFVSQWKRKLRRLAPGQANGETAKGSLFQDEDYLAVARLLRHQAGADLGALAAQLEKERFGKPITLLGRELGGPRDDKAVVRHTAEGRKKIRGMLKQLDSHELVEQRPHLAGQLRRIAVELLADHVAQGVARARAEKPDRRRSSQSSASEGDES